MIMKELVSGAKIGFKGSEMKNMTANKKQMGIRIIVVRKQVVAVFC
jgi:hypothetical protein